MSRDLGRARDFARRHGAAGGEAAHERLDTLLADPELDAMIIATPDKLHAEQTIAAAKVGKHVLVEKPMATDAESAPAMVRACRNAGVVLAVAYHGQGGSPLFTRHSAEFVSGIAQEIRKSLMLKRLTRAENHPESHADPLDAHPAPEHILVSPPPVRNNV